MKLIKTVEIPALKGNKVIADSRLFNYIDSDFKNWGADKKGVATKKIKLDVFEMDEDATFAQMMSTDNLLTQGQILYFIEKHKDLLSNYRTFFPFKSGNEVFVACVYVDGGGGLLVGVGRFSDDYVWSAEDRHRFVVPQLTTQSFSDKTLSPSDSLTLESAIAICKKAGLVVYEPK